MQRTRFFSLFAIVSLFLPTFVYAEGFTLAPPASDISLQYLSNIFGVVSGVLHGSGTQIFGHMFNVFNSAVLALGGIVVTYTLMVSTLNTAGQGEIMGKEWSSIWIPIRSAGGIALLLPKGTGYSAIQVFMMWVVIQGIGAADRIWETTLDYLKQGGVIIQQNASGLTGSQGGTSNVSGARPQAMANIGKLFLNAICLQSYQDTLQIEYRNNPAAYNFPPPNLFGLVSTQITYYQTLITNSTNSSLANSALTNISGGSALIGLPWPASPGSGLKKIVGSQMINAYNITNKCGNITVTYPTKNATETSSSIARTNSAIAPLAHARLTALQQMISDLQGPAMSVQTAYIQAIQNGQPLAPLGFTHCNKIPTLPCVNGTCTNGSNLGVCSGSELNFGTGFLTSTLFQDTLADYTGIVYAAAQTIGSGATGAASIGSNIVQTAKRDGWLMAGSYYINLANANNNANNFGNVWNNSFPITVTQPSFSTNNLGWIGVLNDTSVTSAQNNINHYINGAMNYYTNQGNIGTRNAPVQTIMIGGAVGLTLALGPLMPFLFPVITGIMQIFLGMIDLLTSQQANMNPIVSLAVVGGGLMNISVGFFITGGIFSFALGLGLGAVPCLNLGSAATALAAWLAPLVAALTSAMFVTGAMMSYYIPMIPFILFTFAGIGWLIGVIEAIIAAPLVALGIAHPEGHQAFGKGEPAILLTAHVFLKPSLMLFGYIAGISLSYVGIWILNRGFVGAFYSTMNTIFSAGTGIGSLISMIGTPLASIILYTILCMIIVQKAFSLIHLIPERVLRWIGGAAEGHGEQEMLQQGRGGMEKAYQAQGGAIEAGAKGGADELNQAARKARGAKKDQSGGGKTEETGSSAIQPGGGGAGGGGSGGDAGSGGSGGAAAGGGGGIGVGSGGSGATSSGTVNAAVAPAPVAPRSPSESSGGGSPTQ